MSMERKEFTEAMTKFVESCGEEEPNWEKSFSSGWEAGWKAALQTVEPELKAWRKHKAERDAFWAEQRRVVEAGGHGPGSDF